MIGIKISRRTRQPKTKIQRPIPRNSVITQRRPTLHLGRIETAAAINTRDTLTRTLVGETAGTGEVGATHAELAAFYEYHLYVYGERADGEG